MLQDAEREEPGSFWVNLGYLCKNDYWLFLRVILRFRWADPWWHGEEMCGFLEKNVGNDIILIVPRESGKSTIVTGPYPAWRLADNPNLLTQVTNATEPKAARMGRVASRIISHNLRYQRCYPKIRPSSRWGAGGYYLDMSLLSKEVPIERNTPNIGTYGVGGNITGDHVGLQIHDDLINHKTHRSLAELANAENFFREALRCCEAKGQIVVCCTRWNFYDLYGKVLEGVIRGPKGMFKSLVRGAWGKPGYIGKADEIIWKQRRFDKIGGGIGFSGYTQKQLVEYAKAPLGSALYLSKPLLDEDIEFDVDLVDVFDSIPFETAPIRRVGVECESQGHGFIEALRLKKRYEGRSFPVDILTSHKEKKDSRIRNGLTMEVADGNVHIVGELWEAFKKEALEFPKGHDDLLDASEYCRRMVREPPEGQAPVPYMAIDPAYTVNYYSDHTAVVIGCRYRGDFWILDGRKFQTDRPEVIIKMIFKYFDRFKHGVVQKMTQRPEGVGFRSLCSPGSRRKKGQIPDMKFDLSGYRKLSGG